MRIANEMRFLRSVVVCSSYVRVNYASDSGSVERRALLIILICFFLARAPEARPVVRGRVSPEMYVRILSSRLAPLDTC